MAGRGGKGFLVFPVALVAGINLAAGGSTGPSAIPMLDAGGIPAMACVVILFVAGAWFRNAIVG